MPFLKSRSWLVGTRAGLAWRCRGAEKVAELESASSSRAGGVYPSIAGAPEKSLMNQVTVTDFPVTDRVREAMAVSLRGVDELIPQDEWMQKLAHWEATRVPHRIKLGLDPTAPDIH